MSRILRLLPLATFPERVAPVAGVLAPEDVRDPPRLVPSAAVSLALLGGGLLFGLSQFGLVLTGAFPVTNPVLDISMIVGNCLVWMVVAWLVGNRVRIALALSPLQSLDAEFRWENCQAGLAVAFLSACTLLYLPISGIHVAIVAARDARIADLQARINACSRSEIATLDVLMSHRDRIQALHTWPLDVRLLARAGFYLIIPPLAWVGAALVENLVERLIQ